MDTLEAIAARRSVRQFTDRPVTDAELDILMRAAMAAPSATNEQPWRFVVVREADRLERLSHATPFARSIAGAGVAVVVCADRLAMRSPGFWVIDCAAAIENLLLAAHAIALGGVWLGVHPVPTFRRAVRRIIEAPPTIVPHSLVAIGHPASIPAAVDRFQPDWVHSERW